MKKTKAAKKTKLFKRMAKLKPKHRLKLIENHLNTAF